MAGQTYDAAESARDQLMRRLSWHHRRKLNGTAIEPLPGGGWGVVVLLDHHLRKPLPVPPEVAGVPVRVADVGPVEALASPPSQRR
jgi:hypothetical protein